MTRLLCWPIKIAFSLFFCLLDAFFSALSCVIDISLSCLDRQIAKSTEGKSDAWNCGKNCRISYMNGGDHVCPRSVRIDRESLLGQPPTGRGRGADETS